MISNTNSNVRAWGVGGGFYFSPYSATWALANVVLMVSTIDFLVSILSYDGSSSSVNHKTLWLGNGTNLGGGGTLSRVPTSPEMIIVAWPSKSIKRWWHVGVVWPHTKTKLFKYIFGKVEGDLVMVGEYSPSSNEMIVYMWCSGLIPKI